MNFVANQRDGSMGGKHWHEERIHKMQTESGTENLITFHDLPHFSLSLLSLFPEIFQQKVVNYNPGENPTPFRCQKEEKNIKE